MIYHVLPEVEPFSEHYGGALSRWAANVLRGDENCTIVCPWADATWGFPPEQVWSLDGLRNYVWCLRVFRSASMMSLRLACIPQLLAPLVKRLQKGDTIYIHNRPEFALALTSTCRSRGARVVLHMQNSHLMGWFPERYRSSLDVDGVVFCSEFLKREAAHYAKCFEAAVVIPNGADEKIFFPESRGTPKPGDPVVLFVGRLVPAKGIHVFVDALRLLLRRGVGVSGRIIGATGFGRNRSSQYIAGIKRNLPANVQFGEYVAGQGLAEEFRRATIFCCPSVFNEPFGMVNVEAMATRLPVVASAVGGIPEIFRQGGAILVRPGSAEELADVIELLVRNPAKCQELADRGYHAYKSRFRWQQIRNEYLNLVGQMTTVAA